ncbi:uncharacterized protein STEHIDRAFT_114243 [Stereum hirsutum FP-91666 SS1]|uniref:uncharacterized protein n=1 Tax=Stereum hirsutum (strain FP-91666) TaxID=721885 RepID=UPI0004449A70|nr:uncharacterized protein STEHIDRAFT_114243 [Stereum hirsutum FP-91666 SS1]EIM82305.1 hypothetical protein STEHIDRAFT_114243 [Stereum hirsutum FP-91666 SS1]
MYTLANGDRAIDMPGLHDTRGIDATDDKHSDESILRALLNFLAIQKIDTIHGINWHLQPATRVDGHIRWEAKFIDGLVGRDGWRNVIVLIVENLRPRHEPPIRAAVEPYTDYDALPVRGCVLDEETGSSPRSISMYEDNPEQNVVTLAGLRISHSPIQICILDEACVAAFFRTLTTPMIRIRGGTPHLLLVLSLGLLEWPWVTLWRRLDPECNAREGGVERSARLTCVIRVGKGVGVLWPVG